MNKTRLILSIFILVTVSAAAVMIQPVSGQADFSISASPTILTLYQGGPVGASALSTITVTSLNSLSGAVSFSVSTTPSGFPKVFSLNAPNPAGVTLSAGTSATTTLTVSTNSFAAPGNYTVTVTGSISQPSGSLTHPVSITVTVKPGNLVYINPVQQGPFTTSFTYQVKVANMQPFNGWDIAVKIDTAALSVVSLSITGNLFAANFSSTVNPLIDCVNGGSGITPGAPGNINCVAGEDGPGIAHSSAAISGPKPTSLPSSGLLFTITYTPAAKVHSSTVHVFDDQIFSGNPTPVPHIAQDGLYNPPVKVFSAGANPIFLFYQPTAGGTQTSTLTVTSINGFVGVVSVKASNFGNATISALPIFSVDVPSITLPTPGSSGSATVTITTTSATPPGRYAIVVNATSTVGASSYSVFTKIVVVVPDFGLAAVPSLVIIAPLGGTGGSTLNVTSINGFTGTVNLSVSITSGPSGTCPCPNSPAPLLSKLSVPLTADGFATSQLAISTSTSTLPGPYAVLETGMGSGLTRQTTVVLFVKVQPTLATTIRDPALSGLPVTSMPTGTTLRDNATLTGATVDAGGLVSYDLFSTPDCSGTLITGVPDLKNVKNSIVEGSSSYTFSIAGSYSWNASYSGDSKNVAASSTCEKLTIQAPLSTPRITTAIKDSTGAAVTSIFVGTTVHDNATLSGAFSNAGGTVTYAFWNTATCAGSGTVVGTPVTVTNGLVPDSASHVFAAPGSFSFNATYSGDSQNKPAASPCEPLTVNKYNPSVTTTVKDSTGTTVSAVPTGTTVHDTATLSAGFTPGAVGSTVTYTLFSFTALPSATAPCSGGTVVGTAQTVTITTAGSVPDASAVTPAAGFYGYSATFNGDANNNAATSNCEPLTVASKSTPTIQTTIKDSTGTSVGSITVGSSVHDSATLTGAFSGAGGTVTYAFWNTNGCTGTRTVISTFTVTNSIVPDSSATTPSPAGSFSLNATYSGDAGNNAATSACEPLTVNKTSPTLTTVIKDSTGTAVTSVRVGTAVHDTATLTNSFQAGGLVAYTIFSNSACTPPGPAPFSTVTVTGGVVPDTVAATFTNAGSYSWNATYTGDSNNNPAKSPCEPLNVMAISTIATVIKDSTGATVTTIAIGQSVHDASILTGATNNAGGTITYAYWNAIGCTGTRTVASTVTVTNAIAPDSAAVTFNSLGSFSFNATYSGDSVNSATTSPCEPLTVSKTSPTLLSTLSATTITVGGSVSDSATLIGSFQASGTVTYTLFTSGACTGSGTLVSTVTVTNGVVPPSMSHGFNSVGSFSWNVTYAGDANNNPASTCEPLTVVQASPSLATVIKDPTITAVTSIRLGTAVHDTATLTSSFQAGGSLTYTIFSNNACTAPGTTVSTITVTGGVVADSAATTPSSAGSYSFQASYTGDVNNNPATSPCEPLTVISAPNLRVDSISVSPDPTSPITAGTKVTFNVRIVNNGTADENFQIWIRWGSVTVANQNFSLASGQTQTFTLTWDTSQYGAATNAISAVVPPVPGETIPDADNTLQGPRLTLVAAPQPVFSSLLSSPAFYVGLPVAIIIVLIALYLVLRGRKTVTA